jgi:predicted LPLAT superfamily acyltransferase
MTEASGWTASRERGTVFFIRLSIFLVTSLGRGLGRGLVRVIAFYYALFARSARRAAADYLRRVSSAPPRFADVYRQILRFAQVTLDAVLLVAGKTKYFRVTTNGHEHLAALRDGKKGAILLGAHLGSFYAMRMQSDVERLPIHAVVFTKNARMINDALTQIDPGGNATLIEMDPDGGIDFMLRIKELVEGGALVAMLADRVTGNARAVSAPFLGGTARFAAGPFLLASMLKCPVYMTFGLYRDPDRYDLFCEPFADRIELPRKDRERALDAYVARYAARLEHFVRLAPDNWFNFFDFWPETPAPSPAVAPTEAAPR